MKTSFRIASLLGLSIATLSASGWKIPEQSLNATALSAAYVAGANGADASYYNPANMSFMKDGASLETALTYIKLPSIKYTDTRNSAGDTKYNADSKVENFYVPTFHYVSPKQGNIRYGLSLIAPGGLSKRWDESYAKTFAEEFSLKIIEANPTVSYLVSDKFSLGFGLRGVYTDGTVKSDGFKQADLRLKGGSANDIVRVTRNLEGDSFDFGYNLALSYKAMEDLLISATYRSNIDLTVKGSATLSNVVVAAAGGGNGGNGAISAGDILGSYDGGANVTVPLPASLSLAANYDFGKTDVEFVFERTYWSKYKELDFNYNSDLSGTALSAFDNPIPKKWKDTNAYRIGVTHHYSDKLKLMAGFAYDEAGARLNTLGFELPDSDAKLYSLGFEYKLDDKMSIGLAYLYDQKESITVNQRTTPLDPRTGGVSGTFEDASAHLLTASLKYKF